jgi:YD repeat-containing protein
LTGYITFGGVRFDLSEPGGYSTETYGYDGGGRLLTVQKDDILKNTRSYDGASRELTDTTVTLVGNNQITSRTRTTVYDDDGRTVSQTTLKGSLLESAVTYGDSTFSAGTWSQGFDAAGNLRGYSVNVYENGSPRYTTTYTIGYQLRHGYQETTTRATNVVSPGAPNRYKAPADGETNRYYNVAGELVRFEDLKDKDRYFANNARGQATTVVEGEFGAPSEALSSFRDAIKRPDGAVKAQHFFFLNDNLVGSFGQLQDASGAFKANFDTNYTAISADYPASVPSQVVVQSGETLRLVAARVFGDPALWYVLAEENGLTNPDAVLQEGRLLRVPNSVVSLGNTATTFKPFSASEAIGDTTPTQPVPPASKGCGVLGQIILIAVAVVVSIYTAGAFAGLGAVRAQRGRTGLAALGSSVLAVPPPASALARRSASRPPRGLLAVLRASTRHPDWVSGQYRLGWRNASAISPVSQPASAKRASQQVHP